MPDSAPHGGRPRSQTARVAVLHAVDDLLAEVGYGAMTMKGIAQRAGVGRQTVYRWWSTKAEVLYEATVLDARNELATPLSTSTRADLTAYLAAVQTFLTQSAAGNAYRTLLGLAQHDPDVAAMLGTEDPLGDSALKVLDRARDRGDIGPDLPTKRLIPLLLGPLLHQALIDPDQPGMAAVDLVDAFLLTATAWTDWSEDGSQP